MMAGNVSAVEFKSYKKDGRVVFSNIPKNCVKDGRLVCYQYSTLNQQKTAYDITVSVKSRVNNINKVKPKGSAKIPARVLDKIKLEASIKWLDDYRMQRIEVDKQVAAYQAANSFDNESVPDKKMGKDKMDATKKRKNNY